MSFLDYTGLQRLVTKIKGLLSALDTRVATLEAGGSGVTETLLWEGSIATGGFTLNDFIQNYDYVIFCVYFTGTYESFADYIFRVKDFTQGDEVFIGRSDKYLHGSLSNNTVNITNAKSTYLKKIYGIKL